MVDKTGTKEIRSLLSSRASKTFIGGTDRLGCAQELERKVRDSSRNRPTLNLGWMQVHVRVRRLRGAIAITIGR
jgi:hypothetical protein